MKQAGEGGLKLKAPKGAKARGGAEDERETAADKKAEAAAKAIEKQRKDADQVFERAARGYLQGRHVEWLERLARREGRTFSQMLDALVRRCWQADSSKGGLFTESATSPAKGRGEHGVDTVHPASAGE